MIIEDTVKTSVVTLDDVKPGTLIVPLTVLNKHCMKVKDREDRVNVVDVVNGLMYKLDGKTLVRQLKAKVVCTDKYEDALTAEEGMEIMNDIRAATRKVICDVTQGCSGLHGD